MRYSPVKPAWPALVWLLQHTALNAAEPRQQHRTKQQLVFRCTDSAFGVPGAMVILPPAATETIRAPSMVCLLERPASMVLAKGRKVEPRANRATPPLFSLFPRFIRDTAEHYRCCLRWRLSPCALASTGASCGPQNHSIQPAEPSASAHCPPPLHLHPTFHRHEHEHAAACCCCC